MYVVSFRSSARERSCPFFFFNVVRLDAKPCTSTCFFIINKTERDWLYFFTRLVVLFTVVVIDEGGGGGGQLGV